MELNSIEFSAFIMKVSTQVTQSHLALSPPIIVMQITGPHDREALHALMCETTKIGVTIHPPKPSMAIKPIKSE